jgi:gas vesicle structural protein
MTAEPEEPADREDELEERELVLGDLLNHVLDKGVVISGDVIISIADIDLLSVELKLVLASVQTALEHNQASHDVDVSLLRSDAAKG